MTKDKPLKKLSMSARYKNPTPLCGKKGAHIPPAEFSCGADKLGTGVRGNYLLLNAYKRT